MNNVVNNIINNIMINVIIDFLNNFMIDHWCHYGTTRLIFGLFLACIPFTRRMIRFSPGGTASFPIMAIRNDDCASAEGIRMVGSL